MSYIDQMDYSELLQKFSTGQKAILKENVDMEEKKKPELKGGQKKIAAAAPPPDEITGADFAALKAKKGQKDETIHRGMTGVPNFNNLSVDERKQLKEYISTVKTVQAEIKKLVEKAKMQEVDTTGKIMPEMFDDEEGDGLPEIPVDPGAEDAAIEDMEAADEFTRETGLPLYGPLRRK